MSNALSPSFYIKVNDRDTEVFMSFGILNTISGYFESPEQLSEIFLNPQVRESLVVELFSERNAKGRIVEPINIATLNIDPNDILELLEWVAGHIENFFTQALKKANQRMRTRAIAPTV